MGGLYLLLAFTSCSTTATEQLPEVHPAESPNENPVASQPNVVEETETTPKPTDPLFLPRSGRPGVPDDATQAVVVSTTKWKDFRGEMIRFERNDGGSPWNRVDVEPMPVTLGRYGMAWGRGLHEEQEHGPIKFEGDHRSPAGVFDLGEARGYATEPPEGTTWPFQHSGIQTRCMDDPRSDAYNTFISTQGMPLPASVGMARRETVFELMLFVMHNTAPVLRGAGSCVFLHIWAKPELPTQGCVVMSIESLSKVLTWLDLERRPVIIQLPVPVHRRFGEPWSLPPID